MKYNDYDDGWKSMSAIIHNNSLPMSTSEALTKMVDIGECIRKPYYKPVASEEAKICRMLPKRGLVFDEAKALEVLNGK